MNELPPDTNRPLAAGPATREVITHRRNLPQNLPAIRREAEMTPLQLSFVCGLILAFTFTVLLNLNSETADEGFHTPQIWGFYNGDFTIAKELTMLPAYHAAIAGLLKAAGFFSVDFARFIHMLLSLWALPVFYGVCRTLSQQQADTRTLLFLSCPVILPFFSLIYTDLPSLVLVLLMVYFSLRSVHWLAAAIGLLAIATRQTNLIWLCYCATLVIADQWQQKGWAGFKEVKTGLWPLFLKLLPYGLVVFAAGVFFLLNKGVAVGDAHQHTISLNLSNLYFFLLISFVFLLPYNLANIGAIAELFRRQPKLWFVLGGGFILFMATYSANHQYNSFGLSFYLRNVILHYTINYPALKLLTFVPVAWMFLSFAVFLRQSDRKLALGLLYLFGCLSFIPLPLIEQRYYMVAFVLFLALKPNHSAKLDMVTLFLYIPLNCALLYTIAQHQLFL